ncbi:MAG: hypothetical protein IJU95_06505 [Treponema sp.]|nr:hypothetical protein [Treponema sp.]
MQYNYFPGRLRFRDPVLRDKEIRSAALEAVAILCPQAQISYKESTASILAIYPPESVNPDSLKVLIPYLLKLEPKIHFYTPRKKDEVLVGIAEIKSVIQKIVGDMIK